MSTHLEEKPQTLKYNLWLWKMKGLGSMMNYWKMMRKMIRIGLKIPHYYIMHVVKIANINCNAVSKSRKNFMF